MVDKKFIVKSIDEAIWKCRPTLHDLFSEFNSKDFTKERYSRKEGQIRSSNPSPVGPLQQLQEELQDSIDYSNEEKSILNDYTVNFWPWTSWFYHFNRLYSWELDVYNWHWEGEYNEGTLEHVFDEPKTFKEFSIYNFDGYNIETGHWDDGRFMDGEDNPHYLGSVPFPKTIEILDNMIEKSPPLQQNTLLYRVGVFDSNLMPGDTGKFKSYTSTSFNSYVAKVGIGKYTGFKPSKDCYQLKIYAPKGTKGVVPCGNTGCMDWQSEFTLGRNQKYIVISVDHLNKEAEILLY